MKNPKFSIIIPCYNTEMYIRDCLDSILNQSYKDIEVLCLNDASTDNTLEILKEYSYNDKRVKIFNFSSNQKAGALRNIGISKATGKWLLFCDSDDWYEDVFFEKLQNKIVDLSDDINIIEFNFNISIDKNNKKQAKWLNRGESGLRNVKDVNIMLATGNGNKLYRKSFIDKYKLKNSENNMSGEEIPLHICSFLLSENFYYLNEIGYNWRTNPLSVSRNKNNNKFLSDVFKMTDFLKAELIRLDIYNSQKYHNICRTIYNWHIKEKRSLSISYLNYYQICNKLYKKWGVKKNKPIIFVIIELLIKKMVGKYDN